jgi:hypothetical protein
MTISDPAHWKEPFYSGKVGGPKFDKIVEMIAELNTPTVPPIAHETSHRSGGSDALTDVAFLSGNQTINGIKTFGSIPVLPASNPSSDNQATRKQYVDEIMAIGSANKRWIMCSFTADGNVPIWDQWRGGINLGAIENRTTTNTRARGYVPLATVLSTGHNLVITQVRFGLPDADGSNYVSVLKLLGINSNSSTALVTDSSTWTTVSEHTVDIADQTVNAYRGILVDLECVVATASALEVMHIDVEYYYS